MAVEMGLWRAEGGQLSRIVPVSIGKNTGAPRYLVRPLAHARGVTFSRASLSPAEQRLSFWGIRRCIDGPGNDATAAEVHPVRPPEVLHDENVEAHPARSRRQPQPQGARQRTRRCHRHHQRPSRRREAQHPRAGRARQPRAEHQQPQERVRAAGDERALICCSIGGAKPLPLGEVYRIPGARHHPAGATLRVTRSMMNRSFFSRPGGTQASPGASVPKISFGLGKPLPQAVLIVASSA